MSKKRPLPQDLVGQPDPVKMLKVNPPDSDSDGLGNLEDLDGLLEESDDEKAQLSWKSFKEEPKPREEAKFEIESERSEFTNRLFRVVHY